MTDHYGNVTSNPVSENAKHFKILIPVWGEVYIDRLVKFTLSSLLASGNLKSLRSNCDSVEVVFITTKFSTFYINIQDVLKRIKEYAEVSYCLIDDLLAIGYYGVILTLSYERAIMQDNPEKQVQTNYIFLNADFVMSNNLLSSVLSKINEGFSAILSPSLRASAESVMRQLSHTISDDAILDLPAREIVKLALQNLHPMAIAAIIDGNLDTEIAHQFFVRPNPDLLIGRFFLLFMLCIRPERQMQHVSSYCDYSFIPELCPSGNYCIISDSDEGFLLELAPQDQEAEYIIFEKVSMAQTSKRINVWATKEHYEYSKQNIYFHTKDIPNIIPEVNKLNNTMDELYQYLDAAPRVSHINHPYWKGTIDLLAYKNVRAPFDSTTTDNDKTSSISKTLKIANIIYGTPPYLSKLHYKYLDYKLCIQELRTFKDKNVLCISDSNCDNLNLFFNNSVTKNSRELLNIENINGYDLIFISAISKDIESITKSLLSENLNYNGAMIIFINLFHGNKDRQTFMANLSRLSYLAQTRLKYSLGVKHKTQAYGAASNLYTEIVGERNLIRIINGGLALLYSSFKILLYNIYNKGNKVHLANVDNLSSITITMQMREANEQ